MNLSPESRLLLQELKERPEWQALLDQLRVCKAPLYKPLHLGDSRTLSPEIQEKNWIFDSGVYKENTRIINELSGVKPK